MDLADVSVRMLAAGFLTFIARGSGWTQPTAGPPPAVGIVEAIRRRHARRKLNRDFMAPMLYVTFQRLRERAKARPVPARTT